MKRLLFVFLFSPLLLSASSASSDVSQDRTIFNKWCNETIPAQSAREHAFQQLLVQAQAQTEGAQHLRELYDLTSNLTEATERARMANEVRKAIRNNRAASAQFDSEDADHDAQVLRHVDDLQRTKGIAFDVEQLDRLRSLAASLASRSRDAFQLLQTSEEADHSKVEEVVILGTKTENQEATSERAFRQYFSSLRSLDVLGSAIEEESEYLANIKSACWIGSTVFKRLENTPAASSVAATATARVSSAKMIHSTSTESAAGPVSPRLDNTPAASSVAATATASASSAKMTHSTSTESAVGPVSPRSNTSARVPRLMKITVSSTPKTQKRAGKIKHTVLVAVPSINSTKPGEKGDINPPVSKREKSTSEVHPASVSLRGSAPKMQKREVNHLQSQDAVLSRTGSLSPLNSPAKRSKENLTNVRNQKKAMFEEDSEEQTKVADDDLNGENSFPLDDSPAPSEKPSAGIVSKKKAALVTIKAADEGDNPKTPFDETLDSKAANNAVADVKHSVENMEAETSATATRVANEHGEPKKPNARTRLRRTANPVIAASAGDVPSQYKAWAPSDSKPMELKKKAALAQMQAEFDDDDDEPPNLEATKKSGSRRNNGRRPSAEAVAASEADGVLYDDDDLPKHHPKPIALELSGDWRSLMKKKTTSHKTQTADSGVLVSPDLFLNGGSLPSQYTAWQPSPSDEAKGATAVSAADNDEQDGVNASFLQLQEVISGALAGGVLEKASSAALSEHATKKVNPSELGLAHLVLLEYAKVLNSTALNQLASAHLSVEKLERLVKRLQDADPMRHPEVLVANSKQAQAVRWCQYFQEHEQSIGPMRMALATVHAANSALANSSAQRAAISEEADARSKLQQTVEKDISALTTLIKSFRLAIKEADISNERLQDAHLEVEDALEATLKNREAVLEAHKIKLTELRHVASSADEDVVRKKKSLAKANESVASMREKVDQVRASCGKAFVQVQKRAHAGHMEAHAVEVALKVAGRQS